MKLGILVQGDVTVLTCSGEFGVDAAPKFSETIASVLTDQRRDLLVDLGGVTKIDSAGLEVLTAAHRWCEERLGMVRICGADATLQKIFEMTRLDKMLTLCDSREEAMSGFSQV